jgi:hypothetical protein
MFPIDCKTMDYDRRMLALFDEQIKDQNLPWKLEDILPKVLAAGEAAGVLSEEGAALLDPTGKLQAGIQLCPPKGDAGTGMVATNSVAERTGNVSAGTSVFAMIVLESLCARLRAVSTWRISCVSTSSRRWTALRFATTHPDCISRLVVLAPSGIAPTRPSFILKAIALSMFRRWGAERINRIVFGKQTIHPEAVRFMDAIMTYFKARKGKEYLFSDEELQRLDMPTLLIGGTDDALIPMETVVPRMQKCVPQLQYLLIPGMGHALINLSAQIIPFLAG